MGAFGSHLSCNPPRGDVFLVEGIAWQRELFGICNDSVELGTAGRLPHYRLVREGVPGFPANLRRASAASIKDSAHRSS